MKKISFETGIPEKTIENDLKAFERIGKVKYINNYVVLVNFLKHQNFNTNMMKSAIDVYNNLPNNLKDNKISVSKNNPLKGFEILLNHFGMVSKVEVEVEVEYEVELEFKEESKNDLIIYKSDLEIKLIEFYKFRKELKKPIVESSKEQFLQKLKTLSNNNESNAIKILNQSIANGWQGIFEIKTIENGNKSAKLNGEQRDKELAEWKLFGKNNISKFNPEN
jgi:hypothetical protein